MKASFDYSGCNIFISGGTSGINLGIAEAFAESGARVGVGSRSRDKVDAALEKLAKFSPDPLGYCFDVRDAEAVRYALNDFSVKAGPIDVLVSGAAGNFLASAENLSVNGFKAVVDIDLVGTFHVMKAAFDVMRRPGGSIINISAPQAEIPMAEQIHVCAAKAGVDMVTRCLALEWGPLGIRVNGVVPGPIAGTEGMSRLTPDQDAKDVVTSFIPLRRFGTINDVASTCLFLGSHSASYTNGAILSVDGGWMVNGAKLA